MLRKNNLAFSLVELLVAISLLAILSTVSYSGYQAFSVRAIHTHMLERVENTMMRTQSEIALSQINDAQFRFESGAMGMVIETDTLRNPAHLSVLWYDWKAMSGSLRPIGFETTETISSTINAKRVSSFLVTPGKDILFSFTGSRLEQLRLESSRTGNVELYYFTPGTIDQILKDPYILSFSGTTSTGVVYENFKNKKILRTYEGTPLDQVDLILQNSTIRLTLPLIWK